MRYIALLRGINIGGHQVTMDRLRALFTELGFERVASYIQTGNLFFDSAETDRQALAARIEAHLAQALGYEVPTFLRTTSELEVILALDPFKDLTVTDEMRLAIVFVDAIGPRDWQLPLRSPKSDMEIIQATETEAFVVWYIIGGRPPTNAFLDKTLGKRTTSRFFHTSKKILDAALK